MTGERVYPGLDVSVAFHESGHCVALVYYLRRAPREVVVAAYDDLTRPHGGGWTDPGRDYIRVRPYVRRSVEREVLVALAGVAAQRRAEQQCGLPAIAADERSPGSDMWLIGKLFGAGLVPQADRPAMLDRLRLEIDRLFSRPDVWLATTTIAVRLIRDRKISGDLAQVLIKFCLGRRLTQRELAMFTPDDLGLGAAEPEQVQANPAESSAS